MSSKKTDNVDEPDPAVHKSGKSASTGNNAATDKSKAVNPDPALN